MLHVRRRYLGSRPLPRVLISTWLRVHCVPPPPTWNLSLSPKSLRLSIAVVVMFCESCIPAVASQLTSSKPHRASSFGVTFYVFGVSSPSCPLPSPKPHRVCIVVGVLFMGVFSQRVRDGRRGRLVRLGVLSLADLDRAPHVNHRSSPSAAPRLHGSDIGSALGQR